MVEMRAVRGKKEQMAMDGGAPAAWQVDCEHRDGAEGEVAAQDVKESEEHQQVQARDGERVESAAAMRAGRAGPSRRATGRTAGLGSWKEESTVKAVEPSWEPLVTESKSLRLAEAKRSSSSSSSSSSMLLHSDARNKQCTQYAYASGRASRAKESVWSEEPPHLSAGKPRPQDRRPIRWGWRCRAA